MSCERGLIATLVCCAIALGPFAPQSIFLKGLMNLLGRQIAPGKFIKISDSNSTLLASVWLLYFAEYVKLALEKRFFNYSATINCIARI